MLPTPFLSVHRGEVTALASKHRLPTMYYLRDYVDAGGLMAYAPDLNVQFRRAADYVDKILKGARPGDLPIGNRQSSNSWSTSRPQRRSASPSPNLSCCVPTR